MKWLSGFEADLEREMAEWFWCDGSGLVVDAADVDVVDGAWSREVRCAVCLSIAQSLSSAWRCLVVGAVDLDMARAPGRTLRMQLWSCHCSVSLQRNGAWSWLEI